MHDRLAAMTTIFEQHAHSMNEYLARSVCGCRMKLGVARI
jgi:hypothetical protein